MMAPDIKRALYQTAETIASVFAILAVLSIVGALVWYWLANEWRGMVAPL